MAYSAAAKPALRKPLCAFPNGSLLLPYKGIFGPTLLSFGSARGDAMAAPAACAVRLFVTERDNLLDILRKWGPLPGNTGQDTVNNSCAGDLWRYSQNKTGPEGNDKVREWGV